jgi:hypothetical protein
MANETLDFLMKNYGAADWLKPERQRQALVVRGLAARTLVDGMQPLRVQELEAPAEATDVAGLSRALKVKRTPVRLTDSTWTPDDAERRLVHVRTFECDSRAAARAQLLQLLAEIQGPPLERTDAAGEVAFAAPGNTTIAGVRGNVAFIVTNGGEELLDLAGVAATVDRKVTEGLRKE